MEAYSDALTYCSTPEAPWYIVPANKKWYRNLAVCEASVQTMREYNGAWVAALESE